MLAIFIIFSIVLTLTSGIFFAMMVITCMPDNYKWRKRIAAIIIPPLVGFGLMGAIFLDNAAKVDRWNNGVCPQCGTEWRLVNVEHSNLSGTNCYYVCDDCGTIIKQ